MDYVERRAIAVLLFTINPIKQVMVIEFFAKEYPYEVLRQCDRGFAVYPLIKDVNGPHKITSIGPLHGRSYVVGRKDERYVVSKGNGLSYTQFDFLFSGELSEMGDDTWGLLLQQDALRDFDVGNDAASLGIKTNWMEYVLSLDKPTQLPNGHVVNPTLLQYSVECPYRICDAPFMDHSALSKEVEKWEVFNTNHFDSKHLIAADVMVRNLRLMHDNGILHNAIHEQNYRPM